MCTSHLVTQEKLMSETSLRLCLLSSVWCTCIHCKHWQPINNLKLLLSDSTKVQEDTLHLLIKSIEEYRRLLNSLKLSRLAVHQYSDIDFNLEK